MRVICDKCHGKARITTRREITPRFTKLYCVCNNAECGHSFVMHLEFAHTISQPASPPRPSIGNLFHDLTINQKQT